MWIYIMLWIYIASILCYVFLGFRNAMVGNFRRKVNYLAAEYSKRHNKDGWEFSYNKLPPYNDMLFSIKRLRLESYFDKQTIEKLLS